MFCSVPAGTLIDLGVRQVTNALIYHFVAFLKPAREQSSSLDAILEWLLTTCYFLGSGPAHQKDAGRGSGYQQGIVPREVLQN